MLIVKVFVNEREIDRISLVNTGHVKKGLILYRFRQPAALNHVEIWHDWKKRWSFLVKQALDAYNNWLTEEGKQLVSAVVDTNESCEPREAGTAR